MPLLLAAACGSAYLADNAIAPSSMGELQVSARPYSFDDPALLYAGSWTTASPENPVVDVSGDYNHTETFSNAAGSTASVQFSGTTVQWIGPKQSDGGIASVRIDSGAPTLVDLYALGPKHFQQVLFSTSSLSPGKHTLTITVTGSADPASTGTTVSIDAIEVP